MTNSKKKSILKSSKDMQNKNNKNASTIGSLESPNSNFDNLDPIVIHTANSANHFNKNELNGQSNCQLNGNLNRKISIQTNESTRSNLETIIANKKDLISSFKVDDSKRDLEFSTSLSQLNDNNFVHVQNDNTFQLNEEEVSVSVVLNYCKNYVFKTFFRLVSIVGLRPLFGQNTLINLSRLPLIGCFLSSINILYTIFVLFIILLGYLLQATSWYFKLFFNDFEIIKFFYSFLLFAVIDKTVYQRLLNRKIIQNQIIQLNRPAIYNQLQ